MDDGRILRRTLDEDSSGKVGARIQTNAMRSSLTAWPTLASEYIKLIRQKIRQQAAQKGTVYYK